MNTEAIKAAKEALDSLDTLLDDAKRSYHNSQRWCEEGPDYDGNGPTYDELIAEGFDKVHAALSALSASAEQQPEELGEWIDVNKRLPERGQRIQGMSRSGAWIETFDPDEPLGHMTHWRAVADDANDATEQPTSNCQHFYTGSGASYSCALCGQPKESAVIELGNSAPQASQPTKLEDIEQYRLQMAGISTAAIGYWKEGDGIHPDYDTVALRDVAKLYAKYDELYKAQASQPVALDKRVQAIDSAVAEGMPYYLAADSTVPSEAEQNEFFAAIEADKKQAIWEAAIEQAAKVCEDTDIVEAPSQQSMYSQLGDAMATRSACADAIRALRQQAPAVQEGVVIDLNEVDLRSICDTYIEAFGSLPEDVMRNDIIFHVCEIIKAASHPAPVQTGEKTK